MRRIADTESAWLPLDTDRRHDLRQLGGLELVPGGAAVVRPRRTYQPFLTHKRAFWVL